MKLTIAAVVSALVGCAGIGAGETPIRGDVSFTADERAAVERGNVWIAERVGQKPFEIEWSLPHPQPGERARDHTIVRTPTAPAVEYTTEGASSATEVRLTFDPDVPDPRHNGDVLEVLAAHQFGHVWGLGHHPGPGLMTDGTIDAEHGLHWSAEDQAACDAARVCNR